MPNFGYTALISLALLLHSAAAVAVKTASGVPANTGIHGVSQTLKYLISSFPNIKTVAYTHLPDTIWRPLFLGDVSKPMGVVADPLNQRLFVADQDHNKIYWYQLIIEDNGLLKTDGHQHVAVNGVTAYWLNVNGVGDLYFSGQIIVTPPATSYRAVYRMDEAKISSGDATNPVEVYTRSNSGFPEPKVWMPSGVAVDSFMVYWGNQEQGTKNGAVCSGTRQNIEVTAALEINTLSSAVNEVRGMAIAGQSLFYVTPQAIYGQDRTQSSVSNSDPKVGVIQSTTQSDGWDPKSIAYDGEGTMFWTEAKSGIIYQFPAGDTNPHPMLKYVDAPQVYGVTVYSQTGNLKKKKLDKNYGQLQTSAQVDESGALCAFQLRFIVTLLPAAAAYLMA
jgi:hypothetical protein